MDAPKKMPVTVRFTEDEIEMLEVLAKESFTTRCNVLRRALYLLHSQESLKKSGDKNARP